ncbi:MAG: DUF1540 domain-containing protein [Peptostreptococcaceae bacterium]
MDKINCNVENCSHNCSGTCYSNRVNVGGKGAKSTCDTCCGSFLDKKNYSTLTNNSNSGGSCDCLVCEVLNCGYNDNKLCKANSISISGKDVNLYSETSCETFKLK